MNLVFSEEFPSLSVSGSASQEADTPQATEFRLK